MKSKNECQVCYKITCKQCGWEATDEDVIKIQKAQLTACPLCDWKPGTPVITNL
jgi:hypothetical protein